MLNCRCFAVACVLVLVVSAGPNPVLGDAQLEDNYTPFEGPLGENHSAECLWGFIIDSITPDITNDFDDCSWHETYASTVTICSGMQVFGYGYAETNCGQSVGAAASSANTGQVEIFAISVTAPSIECDWKPRFQMRVHHRSGIGFALAGGQMIGDCDTLDVHVDQSDCIAARSSTAISVVSIGPVSVPVQIVTGTSPVDRTLTEHQHDKQMLSQEWATFSCKSWTQIYAKRTDENVNAESELSIWDSKAGLDLYAECGLCGSYAFVLYNWY